MTQKSGFAPAADDRRSWSGVGVGVGRQRAKRRRLSTKVENKALAPRIGDRELDLGVKRRGEDHASNSAAAEGDGAAAAMAVELTTLGHLLFANSQQYIHKAATSKTKSRKRENNKSRRGRKGGSRVENAADRDVRRCEP